MTVGESLVQFILADLVIKVTIVNVYPNATIPQNPPTYFASYRLISGVGMGDSLSGPSSIRRMRIEVTFWGDLNATTERLAVRLSMALSQYGPMGPLFAGGPNMSIFGFTGPRSVENPVTRLYGHQTDIMCAADLSTVT